MSKVFERCFIDKILIQNDSESDALFGVHQHAYRMGSSTTAATLTLQDYLTVELDKGNVVLLYSTDLSAGF